MRTKRVFMDMLVFDFGFIFDIFLFFIGFVQQKSPKTGIGSGFFASV